MVVKDVFYFGDRSLSLREAWLLARGELSPSFSSIGRARIEASHQRLGQIISDQRTVYGINTGFGPLCRERISSEDLTRLQHNLLKSHSVGMGNDLPLELVRLMLVLKIQGLALGYSGVSMSLMERLCWHLKYATPKVPSQGSLGASGDLAPLAHMSLPLIGEGELWNGDRYLPSAELLQAKGIEPLSLQPKEALSLINGTQFVSAHAVSVLLRLHLYLEQADVIAALSLEGFLGSVQPFEARIHKLRPYRGSQLVAHRLSLLLEGSEMLASHKDCERVQDPYSFRCVPQVHGASREAWLHLKEQTTCEINSVTDNPLILETGETYSGGNFHAQLLALPLDYVTIAAAELGSISERRISTLSHGGYDKLPELLVANPGLNSGFMMPHYTAASLVSENKTLSHPASVDSIPTSLEQEDHVSMGAWAGRKCLSVLDNLEKILGIELLYAAQSFDFRRPRRSSNYLEVVHQSIREQISPLTEDRILASDMEKATSLVKEGRLLASIDTQSSKWLPDPYLGFTI